MKSDKVAILTKKAALEYDRLANSILQKYGLTGAQYKILKYLYTHEEKAVRQVDLERFYSLTHPTAIGLLEQLEKKGFVQRRVNPDDGRSRIVSLTPQAAEKRDELEMVGAALEKSFTAALSEEERGQLVALLQKLLSVFEQGGYMND